MTNDKIVILDYSWGDVLIIENVPTQEYIDVNHDGNWEKWLLHLETERDDIPRISDCHWMHTSNYKIGTIKL